MTKTDKNMQSDDSLEYLKSNLYRSNDCYTSSEINEMKIIHGLYTEYFRLDENDQAVPKIEGSILEMLKDEKGNFLKPKQDFTVNDTNVVEIPTINTVLRGEVKIALSKIRLYIKSRNDAASNNQSIVSNIKGSANNNSLSLVHDSDPKIIFLCLIRKRIIEIFEKVDVKNKNSIEQAISEIKALNNFIRKCVITPKIFTNETVNNQIKTLLVRIKIDLNKLSKFIEEIIPTISLNEHINVLDIEVKNSILKIMENMAYLFFLDIKEPSQFHYKEFINKNINEGHVEPKYNNIIGNILLSLNQSMLSNYKALTEAKNKKHLQKSIERNPFLNLQTFNQITDHYSKFINMHSHELNISLGIINKFSINKFVTICCMISELEKQSIVISKIKDYFKSYGEIIGIVTKKEDIKLFLECVKKLSEKLTEELDSLREYFEEDSKKLKWIVSNDKLFALEELDFNHIQLSHIKNTASDIISNIDKFEIQKAVQTKENLDNSFHFYSSRQNDDLIRLLGEKIVLLNAFYKKVGNSRPNTEIVYNDTQETTLSISEVGTSDSKSEDIINNSTTQNHR